MNSFAFAGLLSFAHAAASHASMATSNSLAKLNPFDKQLGATRDISAFTESGNFGAGFTFEYDLRAGVEMEVVSFVEHDDVFIGANPFFVTELDGGVIFNIAVGLAKL